MSQNQRIKVYYNSACPVCKAGIEHQKMKMQGCSVVWNNVHSDDNLGRGIDSELEFVRERLHVVDESGELQIGFDAFLAIWRNSPNKGGKATWPTHCPTPLQSLLQPVRGSALSMEQAPQALVSAELTF